MGLDAVTGISAAVNGQVGEGNLAVGHVEDVNVGVGISMICAHLDGMPVAVDSKGLAVVDIENTVLATALVQVNVEDVVDNLDGAAFRHSGNSVRKRGIRSVADHGDNTFASGRLAANRAVYNGDTITANTANGGTYDRHRTIAAISYTTGYSSIIYYFNANLSIVYNRTIYGYSLY